ncbi:MAG: Lactyl (2) diphospho-(5')guanosine:7,8-didemethyl-8-hydroxy-5-deazariboflavin 2-phospho-L-lactate transferase [uncultured Thermomicrobiales bacterium]|uniref:Lactyl (2) diphospho-(5')guanosine:7,8-didemethyl-8-hydroxy-5-deazarib oflavin 2-phospho-L-lactate transferase n=1 Tax=uncultured Thermomicrobiales bacterium TaxID=1645740 RepID=A0A6J4V180_9BACT|nr:MAG: Lactyl (2) diphospho-(5')guanosine:7,8-didemethyl-8-hydroxy-5-deazariboflavin 2-phospho-L-lactate transferase [uncultured Thermomicrobiales bacterium]
MIVALAGGVGGAKLAQGLQLALPPGDLAVVVNTADDFDLFGLRICPDLDTVLYTLAGLANPETGWGIAGDTAATLGALARLGRDPWFRLGDQDFATHIHRTERLGAGATLTAVAAELADALGVPSRLLPMTDDRVATLVDTPAGRLEFQEYFVRRRQRDDVLGVSFAGIDDARLPDGVAAAIAAAELIVVCPSNPIVSVGPILAVPGMRAALEAAAAPVVAVSPIVGGRALKGPADRMLGTLGHAVSAAGVAGLYAGWVDAMVLDAADGDQAPTIAAELGMATLVTDTVMGAAESRRRLAEEVLAFGRGLVAGRGRPSPVPAGSGAP